MASASSSVRVSSEAWLRIVSQRLRELRLIHCCLRKFSIPLANCVTLLFMYGIDVSIEAKRDDETAPTGGGTETAGCKVRGSRALLARTCRQRSKFSLRLLQACICNNIPSVSRTLATVTKATKYQRPSAVFQNKSHSLQSLECRKQVGAHCALAGSAKSTR